MQSNALLVHKCAPRPPRLVQQSTHHAGLNRTTQQRRAHIAKKKKKKILCPPGFEPMTSVYKIYLVFLGKDTVFS